MKVKGIIDVCKFRQQEKLPCRNCQYYGKTCEHANKILKVSKPFEYISYSGASKQEKAEQINRTVTNLLQNNFEIKGGH